MSRTLNDTPRGIDALPWERQGRLSAPAPFEERASRYGPRASRAVTEVRPGLTRRGLVYEYVRAHPGTHVRGVEKDLRLATGDLQYHLHWLEKNGFIKTRKSGFYRLVYPKTVFREDQEVLLGSLSNETPREILLCLLERRSMTQGDLARSLGHSQPTVSWHMDRLVQLGLVRKTRTGRGLTYELTAVREDVVSFMKSYHRAVWRRWAGRLTDIGVSAEVERTQKGGPIEQGRLIPQAVVELVGKR